MDEQLTRPGNRKEKRRLYITPSCWDCEHIRVGRAFYRSCDIIPSQHIWAGSPKNEHEEMGFIVAEKCRHFNLANELDPYLCALNKE